MQIVIDMDENLYNAIKDPSIDSGYCANECYNAVYCGTPLPKGHGNLKDEDDIYELLNSINGTAELDKAFEAVEQATTIIKADKESKS